MFSACLPIFSVWGSFIDFVARSDGAFDSSSASWALGFVIVRSSSAWNQGQAGSSSFISRVASCLSMVLWWTMLQRTRGVAGVVGGRWMFFFVRQVLGAWSW